MGWGGGDRCSSQFGADPTPTPQVQGKKLQADIELGMEADASVLDWLANGRGEGRLWSPGERTPGLWPRGWLVRGDRELNSGLAKAPRATVGCGGISLA